MNTLEAIILGMVQGLTEFLPVSSSGHLELAKAVMDVPEAGLAFTVFLHFATCLSLIVVYWQTIGQILRSVFTLKWDRESKFAVKILISMIPAVIAGLLFEEQIDSLFDGNILFVGIMLVITAGLLYFAGKTLDSQKGVSFKNALIVGIAQAIAILPGISRSGATISTSMLLGINRERAATFSFLMVLPVILGKVAKDLIFGDLVAETSGNIVPLLAGGISAFVFGLLACALMIRLIKRAKLNFFAVYCLAVGLISIGVSLFS